MYDICIAGKNEAAVKALYYILENYPKLKLAVLTNQTDNGENSWQPSLMFHAKKNNVFIENQDCLYDIPNLLFISIEYDRLIKTKKYKTKRIFNIHHSLLPKYKGMYTAVFPILNNETESGVTLHRIDDGIDTGNIIDQVPFPIKPNDTCRDLYMNYLENSFEIFKKNFNDLLENKFQESPQKNEGSSYYSSQSIDFKNIEIDLNKTANEINNQLRAYNFIEYQLPKVFGYEIYKTEILPERSFDKPGTIIEKNENFLVLNTIDYKIKLYIFNR